MSLRQISAALHLSSLRSQPPETTLHSAQALSCSTQLLLPPLGPRLGPLPSLDAKVWDSLGVSSQPTQVTQRCSKVAAPREHTFDGVGLEPLDKCFFSPSHPVWIVLKNNPDDSTDSLREGSSSFPVVLARVIHHSLFFFFFFFFLSFCFF